MGTARPIWDVLPVTHKLTGRVPAARALVHRFAERQQWSVVAHGLSDQACRTAFRHGTALPDGYGVGWGERVVEFPWALSRLAGARSVLDAGSTFNHSPLLDELADRKLTVVTLAPERMSFVERGISYLFADLRDLPLRDDTFDAALCVSVLEHVGMDNSAYGAGAATISATPRADARVALGELERVVRRNGRILLTVPFGRRTDLGWQRQFDADDLADLLAGARPTEVNVTVYQRSDRGWQISSVDAAADCEYDGGARAVACAELLLA